jgi:hypothetical protein
MPGPGRDVQVRLYRDALSTPWGFRLHGGKDLRTPLTVQKVAVGSPVFGDLQRDDVILEIQNCDATQMTHKQAQDMIRNAGGSLLLRIRRCGRQDSTLLGTGPSYDSSQLQKGFMMGRVKNTLTTVLDHTMPSAGYGSNTSDYGGTLYSPTSSYASAESIPVKTWNLPKPASRPQPMGVLQEPGWTPECLRHPRRRPPQNVIAAAIPAQRHHQQYPVPATAGASQAVRRSTPPPQASNGQQRQEPPAWYGSLRPSVESRGSDRQVAGVKYRSASPEAYPNSQAPWVAASGERDNGSSPSISAPVKNLQYNSPMGLYSKSNVIEALSGQMGGLAIGADFAKRESEVQRLVRDDDQRHRHSPAAGATLRAPPPSDDSIRQSPSIRILETRFAHPADGATGTSDF